MLKKNPSSQFFLFAFIGYCLSSLSSGYAQSALHYYAFNEQLTLSPVSGKACAKFSNDMTGHQIDSVLDGIQQTYHYERVFGDRRTIYILSDNINIFIDSLDESSIIDAINPVYRVANSAELGVTNEITVDFLSSVSQTRIDSINSVYNATIVTNSFSFKELRLPPKTNPIVVANAYWASGMMKFAHPSFIAQASLASNDFEQNSNFPKTYGPLISASPFYTVPANPVTPQLIPNDEYFQYQWTLNNLGGSQPIPQGNLSPHFGSFDSDVDAPEAWILTQGAPSITVAVIDVGVTGGLVQSHPDLPNSRQYRIAGSNFAPFAFIGDSIDPYGVNDPSPISIPGQVFDNHGTACAGIIAATQNNNIGISGIAPLCNIMPIRVPLKGSTNLVNANHFAAAIDFAWFIGGAQILSNSWNMGDVAFGGPSWVPNQVPAIINALKSAATQGRGGRGCIIVFSTGNKQRVDFPANAHIPSLISVGASDRTDFKSLYCGTVQPQAPIFNQYIDIVAPSNRAWNNTSEAGEVWTIDIPGSASLLLGRGGDNPYPFQANFPQIGENLPSSGTDPLSYTGRFGGTSASAPLVAGIAALMISRNPNLCAQEVHDILMATADKVHDFSITNLVGDYNYNVIRSHSQLDKCDTSTGTGYTFSFTASEVIGSGRVNAYKAVKNCKPTDLYVKDVPSDIGVEPVPNFPWEIVDGNDVWVRNPPLATLTQGFPPRYTNEHQHQDIVWNSNWPNNPATRPHIYVKVRNRGVNTTSCTVHIYYQEIAANDKWNSLNIPNPGLYGSWKEIICGDTDGDGTINNGEASCPGGNTIFVPGNSDYVLDREWNSVAQSQIFQNPIIAGVRKQYCLLVRLESNEDPMNLELLDVPAALNAKNNNNIAQKNVTFQSGFFKPYCNITNVGNVSDRKTINKLEFVDPSSPHFIGANGFVKIDLGETLYKQWIKGGKIGSGILYGSAKYDHASSTGLHRHSFQHPDPNPYQIVITDPQAVLDNIPLSANIFQGICTEFYAYPGESLTPFEFQMRQFESENNLDPLEYNFTGAVKNLITKPACQQVNAGLDVTTGKKCPTILSASPNFSSSVYVWRNNSTGKEVGTGPTLTVNPKITTTYEVEMLTEEHCVSYDLVTVNVDPLLPKCQPPCGPPDYFDQTLTANTTISGDSVVISGKLTVPSGVVLNISNSDLFFSNNARIHVDQGGKLSISNSKLSACDDTQPWKGLVIKGNNSDATQISVTSSTLEDALNPIDLNKVIGANITNNNFSFGTNGIEMNKCKRFTINSNNFDTYSISIYAIASLTDAVSTIKNNHFSTTSFAVFLEKGDHSSLDINCNSFINYSNYAVYSDSTVLKNQGTINIGAGNIFFSTSTIPNNQFRHVGNTIIYYYDPSNPIFSSSTSTNSVVFLSALNDASCGSTTTSNKFAQSESKNENETENSSLINVNEIDFKAFPNPFKDQLTIFYQLPENSNSGSLNIYEVGSGKLVYSTNLNPKENKLILENLNFSSGVYTCKIASSDGNSKIFKIVNIK